LSIDRDQNSTEWLSAQVYESAKKLAVQSHFYARTTAIEDDHIPFAKIGVPVVDVIDLDYGYANAFWHTPNDTIEKLSTNSLEIVGNVVLETVRALSNN
jgi:Zn-dependent M28 family amino/carboxypeptidase